MWRWCWNSIVNIVLQVAWTLTAGVQHYYVLKLNMEGKQKLGDLNNLFAGAFFRYLLSLPNAIADYHSYTCIGTVREKLFIVCTNQVE